MYKRQNSVERTRALIDALTIEVEVRKANKNQQDIFHLQLLQRKSRIFAVIDFNRGDRPLKSKSVLKAYCALFVGTYSQSIGIKISFQYGNRRFDDNLLLQRRASLLPKKDEKRSPRGFSTRGSFMCERPCAVYER
ncbi:hypothetical protein PI95_021870 [Hassallia byssoidea VB512170]|uniref:Uncharacterized protein n=1 Tax=Hassallia byssoidea VB512170 TaxID=1304833 RepID=A0A846HCK1_9CYAN|nr:hypothetical protein [Hassalia byssoidea]NEU75132.1 hypothetical protein [Hassalia byssoidea VB512170]